MPLILIGIPLLAIMAGLVAYGFSQIQHGQSTGFLHWLEGVAGQALFIASPLAEQALKLTSWLTHYLGRYFEATFARLVQFFSGLNQYTRLVASIALAWPQELFRVEQWLVWHEIPKLLKALPNVASRVVHDVVKVVRVVERKVVQVPKISRAAALAAIAAALPIGLRQTFSLLAWLRTHLKALAHLLAHPGLSVPFPNVDWDWLTHGKIGRVTSGIKARLKRLEELTAAAAGVGLLAKAMQRMGINWIRCNNVKRIGKGLCSSPAWLINLLAAGVVEAFILGDLCQFTTLLEAEAEKFKPVLLELVNVENSLINCGDNSAPGRLRLPPLSLPPMPAPSVFAV